MGSLRAWFRRTSSIQLPRLSIPIYQYVLIIFRTLILRQLSDLNVYAESFFRGWYSLGIKTPKDPGAGKKRGVFWAPSSLDPKDETRSYARTAHYDRVIGSRPNYHLLTNTAVQRISILDGKAVGVELIDHNSTELHSVKAGKEIVLAAGSVHSPQILQLSGIGPQAMIEKLGIRFHMDLPGVGHNFQDHPTMYPAFGCMSIGALPSIQHRHSLLNIQVSLRPVLVNANHVASLSPVSAHAKLGNVDIQSELCSPTACALLVEAPRSLYHCQPGWKYRGIPPFF